MGVNITTTCDYPVRKKKCGTPTDRLVETSFDNRRYTGYMCDEHIQKLDGALAAIGIEAVASRIDYKERGIHRAASGATFTMKEARDWLQEHGRGKPRGVLSKEDLELFAASH